MPTLKDIRLRLKSIRNIAKITKSMKMISATKLTRAQKEMERARTHGTSAYQFFNSIEPAVEKTPQRPLIIAVSSDRGLCGAIHSSVSKLTRPIIRENPSTRMIVLGDKSRNQLQREFKDNFDATFNQLGRAVPTYSESCNIADKIISMPTRQAESAATGTTAATSATTPFPYDAVNIVYNRFTSMIAYLTEMKRVFIGKEILDASKMVSYEVEDEVMDNFQEFQLANTLYWTLLESHASEMASRMTAMENATKNANEMIGKLNTTYNRTRQAVITNELVDIITGASAL